MNDTVAPDEPSHSAATPAVPATPALSNQDWHFGRSWSGHRLEDDCPCPQEPCGLISIRRVHPLCEEHPMRSTKTIRQGHSAQNCPGSST